MKREINVIDLKFNEELMKIDKPRKIVIHHTHNPNLTVESTHKLHIERFKWAGIGYNYFIEEDGTVFEGRGMKIGAHTRGMNKISIGICLSGNFDIGFPRQEQLISLKKLCTFFMKKYNISIKRVIGHREVENSKKSCPGTNFDMEQFRKSLI